MMEPRPSRKSPSRVRRRVAGAAVTFALAIGLVAASQALGPSGGQSASARSPASHAKVAGARHADDRPAATEVMDDLEDCSPFYSFDGKQLLDFDDGAVSQSDESSEEPSDEAASAKDAEGAYTADEVSSRVRITLGGTKREYTLVVPADSDQCLLVIGDPNRADLRQSWYGEMTDDPEVRPATVLHTALRRGRATRHAG
jgi:hypothetical protein